MIVVLVHPKILFAVRVLWQSGRISIFFGSNYIISMAAIYNGTIIARQEEIILNLLRDLIRFFRLFGLGRFLLNSSSRCFSECLCPVN